MHYLPTHARGFLAAVIALALAFTGVAFSATSAQAAEKPLDAISDIEITAKNDPIELWDRVSVTAKWDVSDLISPGTVDEDTTYVFSMTLPPEFTQGVGGFDLMDADGKKAGRCTTEKRVSNPDGTMAKPGVVKCVLDNTYLKSHEKVHGTLKMEMQARQVTAPGQDTVDFKLNDKTETVKLPGTGAIVPGKPADFPTDSSKSGWFENDGTLTWRLLFRGNVYDNGLTIEDTLDSRLTMKSATVYEFDATEAAWAAFDNDSSTATHIKRPAGYTLTPDGQKLTFDFTADQVKSDKWYAIIINSTVADQENLPDGTTFDNTAAFNNVEKKARATYHVSGSGTAEGVGVDGFKLNKKIDGDAAGTVPADTQYSVRYSYTADNTVHSGVLRFTAGKDVGLSHLPDGTEVTLSEVGLPVVEGVTWETPVFSGEGVTDDGKGSAKLTVRHGGTVSVTLTNTAEPTPEPTPSTTSQTPTPTETSESPTPSETTDSPEPSETTQAPSPSETTSAPVPSVTTDNPAGAQRPESNGDLPRTGSEGTGWTLAAGLLLLAAGSVALFTARRKNVTHLS